MANNHLLARLVQSGVMKQGDAEKAAAAQAKVRRRSFTSAQISNITASWGTTPKPIDVDVRSGLRILRARARHEAQNNDYVKRFLSLLKVNVIGHDGIALQARAADPNGKQDELANAAIEGGWSEWGRKGICDVTGRFSLPMAQRLFIETVARDGEVLVRKVRGWKGSKFRYAIQFLDSELLDVELNTELRNGNVIRMGVELDIWRRPVAYYLLSVSVGREDYSFNGKKYTRVPADEIIHEFLPEWVWQTRGIPWMSTALLRLNMLNGYEENELVASRASSGKMGFYEDKEGIYHQQTGKDADGNLVHEIDPGVFELLPPGVEFKPYDPQHPSTAYKDFVQTVLRGIAAGLGANYNSLANDLEGVNYNSLRMGAIEDRAMWMMLQTWVVDVFCDPIYRDWLGIQLLAETLTVNGKPLRMEREEKYQSVNWQPRRWPWVDPAKEMSAHETALRNRITSPQRIIRERGDDPDAVLQDWQQWNEKCSAAGISPEPAAQAGSLFMGDVNNADQADQGQ